MPERESDSLIEPGKTPEPVQLKRALGFPLLVLYALGVTIGAGIYVLIGTTAARAGIYAPMAFLLAAFVMAFNAGSFAEFSGRVPQAAGEAAYVDAGFGWKWLTLAVGISIIFSATIAAAAISLGSAGYVGALIDLPQPVIVAVLVVLMGIIAGWGVQESVGFAAILTIIELIGLHAKAIGELVRVANQIAHDEANETAAEPESQTQMEVVS